MSKVLWQLLHSLIVLVRCPKNVSRTCARREKYFWENSPRERARRRRRSVGWLVSPYSFVIFRNTVGDSEESADRLKAQCSLSSVSLSL